LGTLRHDLVYGLRMLAKKPLFTLVIVLSLAIGIGLNTAIFTLMRSILLLPALSGPRPNRDAGLHSARASGPVRWRLRP